MKSRTACWVNMRKFLTFLHITMLKTEQRITGKTDEYAVSWYYSAIITSMLTTCICMVLLFLYIVHIYRLPIGVMLLINFLVLAISVIGSYSIEDNIKKKEDKYIAEYNKMTMAQKTAWACLCLFLLMISAILIPVELSFPISLF